MRQSMSQFSFGLNKAPLSQAVLDRFADLFADYKEKRAGAEEFFLDLGKELDIEKYSIAEHELVAFFSKVGDEMATAITETEFNEILIACGRAAKDPSFKQKESEPEEEKKQIKSDEDVLGNSMQGQMINTILQ